MTPNWRKPCVTWTRSIIFRWAVSHYMFLVDCWRNLDHRSVLGLLPVHGWIHMLSGCYPGVGPIPYYGDIEPLIIKIDINNSYGHQPDIPHIVFDLLAWVHRLLASWVSSSLEGHDMLILVLWTLCTLGVGFLNRSTKDKWWNIA